MHVLVHFIFSIYTELTKLKALLNAVKVLTWSLLLVGSVYSFEQPNIIWVVIEDASPDFGFNGNAVVSTPNIDALAARSHNFTNAFATSPVCSPSRSAFSTGMHATSIDAHQHRTLAEQRKPLPDNTHLMTKFLKDAGYTTLLMGPLQKTDFNFQLMEEPFDFTDGEQQNPYGSYTHGDPSISVFEGRAWKAYEKTDRKTPFFAQINFSEAHRGFVDNEQKTVVRDSVLLPPFYPDHRITREVFSRYYETLEQLDSRIGLLLSDVERLGLADNTILFVFSDHGRAMLRAKQWLYDAGIKVPFLVHNPFKPTNIKDDKLVSLIDILPTTLALAGIDIPRSIQGKDIFDTTKGRQYVFAQKDRLGATEDRVRAIRDKRYKLIVNYFPDFPYTHFSGYKYLRYPTLTLMKVLEKQGKLTEFQSSWFSEKRPAMELYDLINDPHETENLAYQPEQKKVLDRLMSELNKWIVETKDAGIYSEDPVLSEKLDEAEIKRVTKVMHERGLTFPLDDEIYLDWWMNEFDIHATSSTGQGFRQQ